MSSHQIELTIRRSASGVKDRSRYYVVALDGLECARLKPGELVLVNPDPGTHVVEVTLDRSTRSETTIDLAIGESRELLITNGDLTRLGARWIEIVHVSGESS